MVNVDQLCIHSTALNSHTGFHCRIAFLGNREQAHDVTFKKAAEGAVV